MALASPTYDASDAAFAAAGAIVRWMDRDAFLASYFLPSAKRQAAWAVLAFVGMIRDAIGSCETTLENARGLREHPAVVSPQHVAAISAGAAHACGCNSEADERVAMFRERLAEIYENRVELPAVASRSPQQHALEAVGRVIREHRLPRELFLELADGLRQDLATRRYATWTSLARHCYAVGGVVGVLVSGVLGVTHSDAATPAAALGQAIRLTNILRNLPSDALCGRIYLPIEDLVRHRVTEQGLLSGADNARDLIRFEVERARGLFRSAAEGICWLADDGCRLAASVMLLRWLGVLDAIAGSGYDVLAHRADLTGVQKLRLLPAAWRLARRGQGDPLPDLI